MWHTHHLIIHANTHIHTHAYMHIHIALTVNGLIPYTQPIVSDRIR